MTIYQGTLYEAFFTFTETDLTTPVDISTWTFEADFRQYVESTTTLLTITSGFEVVDGATGRLRLQLLAAETELLPEGKVVFDVHRTDDDPGPRWLFRGTVKVRQSVTRDD
jgi:hypothetical protein